MGNLYRFAEPIVLLSIARMVEDYGYSIAQESERLAVTHAGLDTGVVYRTLRQLENAGNIISKWDTSGNGPARRLYRLTESGWTHLAEWSEVIGDLVSSLASLKKACDEVRQTR
jgi:DNA-binding PadR family transcriptional regulator